MERFIAIDNVCAWPNLKTMPNGDLVATIFNQPCHGLWEGDVECWASSDGGRLWSLRGVPAPHEPATNRMNVAAGMGENGTFIVLASGWSKRNPIGQPSSPHEGEILPIWSCLSSDSGATWERSGSIGPLPDGTTRLIPFGDIIQLPDENLGVCLYTWRPTTDTRDSHFYVSGDNGGSWTYKNTIRSNDANETTPLLLANGHILAAARTWPDGRLEIHRSEDCGETWSSLGPVSLPGQHPAHLLALPDNRILLSYGLRNVGSYGIAIRISEDAGETWGDPRVIVNLTHPEVGNQAVPHLKPQHQDVGYPSTAQLDDGTMVTIYYCNGIATHQRYHVGSVRWEL